MVSREEQARIETEKMHNEHAQALVNYYLNANFCNIIPSNGPCFCLKKLIILANK